MEAGNERTDVEEAVAEHVLIEGLYPVYGKMVNVKPDFFPIETCDTDTGTGPSFDSSPPPRDRIIGATPEYVKELIQKGPSKGKKLVPEFTLSDVLTPSNLYWDYPKCVEDFEIFEDDMVRILPWDGDGIHKLICKPGTGETLKFGDVVHVNYYVYVEGSTGCVESNKVTDKPHEVVLGENRCTLPVLELGLFSMTVKETAAFLASPKYCFGKFAAGPWLKENKRILCIIEVLAKVGTNATLATTNMYYMSSLERKSFPSGQIFQYTQGKIEEGKKFAENNNVIRALECYFHALACLREVKEKSEKKRKLLLLRALYYRIFRACYPPSDQEHDLTKIAIIFLMKTTELPIAETEKAYEFYQLALILFQTKHFSMAKLFIEKAVAAMKNEENEEFTTLKQEICSALAAKKEDEEGDKQSLMQMQSLF